MDDKIIEKYFKDGETSQNTLEEIGVFEDMGKQYIFTQDWDTINHWINMRLAIEQTSKANSKHLFDEDVFGVNEFFDYVDSVFKKGRKINE
tara:strand:- start:980 stop:1252 length:273 start_codon:yes stop_codon:yes gene_type:complete